MKNTGTKLFSALLGYVILVILLMTLNPFYITLPKNLAFKFDSSLDNLILNVVLFLPVGFFYRLSTERRGALFFGAGLSLVIELAQLFLPARTTSVPDILTNTLGTGLGELLHSLLSSRLNVTSGVVNRLRLETPLMGLIYLAIPLLWIDVLGLNEAPYRWILTALIGSCGAVIFSNLFRNWQGDNTRGIIYAALAVGIWFLIGIGPRLLHSEIVVPLGLGIVTLTALLTALPNPKHDRRFEQSTLRRILPICTLYLLLLTLVFPFSPIGTWHGFFGFTDRISDTSLYALYPRLESLAAFTVLGYLTAEWRGRLELPLSRDLPRVLLVATSAALLLEILSGFQSGRGASVIRFVLAVIGAVFGGTIYHLSRAHIRFLLGR
jgi:glycopeptide antibiotics resistance protein